jgi:5-methylcytosine-specific restriction protein A
MSTQKRDDREYEKRRRKDERYRARKRIYDSVAWRQCRVTVMTDRGGLCELCKAQGRFEAGTEVHHIRDLADGGAPFDPENLMVVCASCHSSITKSHRIKGCDINGNPFADLPHWPRD